MYCYPTFERSQALTDLQDAARFLQRPGVVRAEVLPLCHVGPACCRVRPPVQLLDVAQCRPARPHGALVVPPDARVLLLVLPHSNLEPLP